MAEKKVETSVPILSLLYKNILLIVMITVLCALLGLGYGLIKVKPVYTATRTVIFRASVEESSSSTTITNVSLAQKYLPTVESLIKSPDVVKKANLKYATEVLKITDELNAAELKYISSGAISVSFGESSLIMTLSYRDLSEKAAIEKLNILHSTANSELSQLPVVDKAMLIDVQNSTTYSVNDGLLSTVAIGSLIGFAISFGVVLLLYALDNTVKDREEFEELTGLNVMAYIEKVDVKKK